MTSAGGLTKRQTPIMTVSPNIDYNHLYSKKHTMVVPQLQRTSNKMPITVANDNDISA